MRAIGGLRDTGTFFGPAIVELATLDQIDKEVFGPILHVIRYDPDDIVSVGAQLSAKGYGLTLGVHSRLEGFSAAVQAAARKKAAEGTVMSDDERRKLVSTEQSLGMATAASLNTQKPLPLSA